MIDIHSHIIPEIDDGSPSMASSITMIEKSIANGVTDIFLTPHYRGKYCLSPQEIRSAFNEFVLEKEKLGLTINVYLGQEIYITSDFKKDLANGKYLPMNDTKFVLIEFDFIKERDIPEVVYDIKTSGYIPIVAHLERYDYANIHTAREIKALGGYIQVNALSIVKETGLFGKKFVKDMLKEKLIDFVASDLHSERHNYFLEAYEYVCKKFDKKFADDIFTNNAKMLIENQA